MNLENKWEKAPISIVRTILLQIFYWGIFMWVLPEIILRILLSLNFSIEQLMISLELYNYIVAAIIAVIIFWPLLKKEWHLDISKMAYTLILCISCMLAFGIVFSIVLSFIDGPEISANQSGLNAIINFDKTKYILMVTVFAPILEELVFRGGMFRVLRNKGSFYKAAIFSSFMFGFMHVFYSFLNGNFSDMIYLFLYGGLGFILACSYEYNKSIYSPIILHMVYNLISCSAIIFS